jgi:hypothetical protein
MPIAMMGIFFSASLHTQTCPCFPNTSHPDNSPAYL